MPQSRDGSKCHLRHHCGFNVISAPTVEASATRTLSDFYPLEPISLTHSTFGTNI